MTLLPLAGKAVGLAADLFARCTLLGPRSHGLRSVGCLLVCLLNGACTPTSPASSCAVMPAPATTMLREHTPDHSLPSVLRWLPVLRPCGVQKLRSSHIERVFRSNALSDPSEFGVSGKDIRRIPPKQLDQVGF